MTPAERYLWQYVRARKLRGLKFRRQVPIGAYIVDFYCHQYRVIIEVDGSIHNEAVQREHDKFRENELKNMGYTVLRFTNEEVMLDIDYVQNAIIEAVFARKPSP